ncbi:MAG: hypothetical protein DMF75_00740 [Acidobacteria bacterium]|nr:MAG: hypothetical protein DMF75_00740 [Acidobacteriota bacterium]
MIRSWFAFLARCPKICSASSICKRSPCKCIPSSIVLSLIYSLSFAQQAGQSTPQGRTTQGQSQSQQSPSQATAQPGPRAGQTGGPPSQRTAPSVPITGAQQVPGAAKTSPGVSTLSFEEAITLALENNLATLLAKERRREARGFETESLAGLLPNVSGAAYQASITENLAALGLTPGKFPGLNSTFIGPFKNFDARVRLEQTIFSLSALRTFQAGRAGVRVAALQENLAVAAAQANVELAQTLLKLAQDQHSVGVATGVDVTRAETRVAQEQVRLARAQTDAEEARLQLQRITGLPLGSGMTLTDPLRFEIETLPAIESSVAQAEDNRAEVRVAEAQVTMSNYEKRAAQAEQQPWLEFLGDYGMSGITPTNTDLPTRRVAVQLNVPIFNGGLTRGRIQVATSRKSQAELQLASVRGQVEEDVRLAFADLRTTAEAVRAADLSVTLASRELEMARDRFRSGVGDNIEVVTAQAALANARLDQVTALAVYNGARLNLAAALGRAQSFRW